MKKRFICTGCGQDDFTTFDRGDTRYARCKNCGKTYAIGGVVTPQPYYPSHDSLVPSGTLMGEREDYFAPALEGGNYPGGSCGGGGSSRSWGSPSESDSDSDSCSSCDCGSSDCSSNSCD